MKALFFDTGPLITLTLNNLLWLIKPLKEKFGGKFLITKHVKKELVEKPFEIKRFKFEALQILKYINDNIIETYDNYELKNKTQELLKIANNCFFYHEKPIHIVDYAEMETLSACLLTKSTAVVVDERTTRLLIERPQQLKEILTKKLHKNIRANKKNIELLRRIIKDIKLIRTSELAIVAYKLGLLDKYLVKIEKARENLLDSILWGIKLNGCAISKREIEEIIKREK